MPKEKEKRSLFDSWRIWATAFTSHAYRWPTIGWMADIEGFTTEDCEAFYKTFYAPNNATIVVVGDVTEAQLLPRVSQGYGQIGPSVLPLEDVRPEPPQLEEKRREVQKPTSTDKLLIGYHSPALGDWDHPIVSLLVEVLFGGRASRIHRRLVRELELASEVRAFVGPFKDPGLIEIFASCREGHKAEELLSVIDEELDRVLEEAIPSEELARGQAQLRQAFTFTNSYAMPQPEILVARAGEKFDADGRLVDETTREYLAKFLVAFAAWIERVGNGR